MAKERIRPKVVVKKLTDQCYSPRGAAPKLIVLHSTESHNRKGKSDLAAIANYFAGDHDASSHVVTDADGQSARCVRDGDAAWTQSYFNRVSLAIEQIGQAASTDWTEAHYKETARWIARWSIRYGIPIRKAWVVGGRVVRSGVTTHAKLGSLGGGHVDPGPNFKVRHVLDLARHFRKRLREDT